MATPSKAKNVKGGIGSIFKIFFKGRYGRIMVIIPTPIVVKRRSGAGLLLKKGLCVRITSKTNNSVIIESTNHPLWNSSWSALKQINKTAKVI